MAQAKGRRRNLKTIKDVAASKTKTRKKSPFLKRFFGTLFRPIVVTFKWLNQPTYIHRPASEQTAPDSWGYFLTKHRSIVPGYIRESVYELKLTSWPNFITAWRLTMAVFLFAVFFAAFVAGLDWILTQVFERIILN